MGLDDNALSLLSILLQFHNLFVHVSIAVVVIENNNDDYCSFINFIILITK